VIFVDANVPMYVVGDDAAAAVRAFALIGRLTADGAVLATNAEVLQEILHRYSATGRIDDAPRAFAAVDTFVDTVLPIERDDVLRACELQQRHRDLQARDCLHLATMERHGITRIATFDRGFDAVPGIERIA
jgi:predicted nucleic acid-binding protein